jgi:hypothetical protein
MILAYESIERVADTIRDSPPANESAIIAAPRFEAPTASCRSQRGNAQKSALMYIASVSLLTFILPAASVIAQLFVFKNTTSVLPLVGAWFVFWAVGVRLSIAGLRQVVDPKFTAEEIFNINSAEPLILVRELGFANISTGVLGISTIFNGGWVMPAAIVGGLFYGLAGLGHAFRKERNLFENVAMYSNFFVFFLLFVYVTATLILP